MSDQYHSGDDMAGKRSAPQPDEPGRQPEQDDEEWVDEAGDGEAAGAGDDWEEEVSQEWVEDQPAGAGKPKPKETPAYMTWVAGVIGLLLGLFAFRGCGGS